MQGPVCVYGASGYTGRLVAAELQRLTIPTVLAGRSQRRLSGIVDELEFSAAEIRTAELNDPTNLRTIFADCAVVINCVGPFMRFGEPVLEAAIEAGAHYCDTTGEQRWIRCVFEQYGRRAKSRGVCVIPAAGFDFVPGDLLAAVAARGIEPLRELVVAYALNNGAASRGTMRTAIDMAAQPPIAWTGGKIARGSRRPRRLTFSFPSPVGERQMTAFPSGEVIIVPRHIRTQKLTSLISLEPLPLKLHMLMPMFPFGTALLQPILRSPLRQILEQATTRLASDPTPQQREQSEWMLAVQAHSDTGVVRQASAQGRDPYGLTAVIIVAVANQLASKGGDGGVFAPAQAFDASKFLHDLAPHGVRYREPADVVVATN